MQRTLRRISLCIFGSVWLMAMVAMAVVAWKGWGWWAGILAGLLMGFGGLIKIAALDDRLRRNIRPYIPPFFRVRL